MHAQTIEQVYNTRYKADCKELELRYDCGKPLCQANYPYKFGRRLPSFQASAYPLRRQGRVAVAFTL